MSSYAEEHEAWARDCGELPPLPELPKFWTITTTGPRLLLRTELRRDGAPSAAADRWNRGRPRFHEGYRLGALDSDPRPRTVALDTWEDGLQLDARWERTISAAEARARFVRRAERVIGQRVENARGVRPGDLDDDGMVVMKRAAGAAPCRHCGRLLFEHPMATAHPAPDGSGLWLVRDCLGSLWHL